MWSSAAALAALHVCRRQKVAVPPILAALLASAQTGIKAGSGLNGLATNYSTTGKGLAVRCRGCVQMSLLTRSVCSASDQIVTINSLRQSEHTYFEKIEVKMVALQTKVAADWPFLGSI